MVRRTILVDRRRAIRMDDPARTVEPDSMGDAEMMPLTTTKDDLTKLRDAINETWAALYPGAEPVTDVFALTMRVRNIAEDRNCWAFNARVLQKQLNEMEQSCKG